MVSDFAGNVRVFPSHADGQNAASVPPAQNYGTFIPTGLAQVGGAFYMGTKLNADGTFNRVLTSGLPALQDIRTNPATGQLVVSTQDTAQIYNVNPTTGTPTLLANSPGGLDGLTITPDGQFLFVANPAFAGITEFNAITGALVGSFALGLIPGIDGLALGFGTLSGNIFANTVFGQVFEINLADPNHPILIATGGSRGDFVTPDPFDGSLLLTQTNSIVRLTPPPGASFAPAIPEPSTFALLGLGAAGLAGWRLRRKPATA